MAMIAMVIGGTGFIGRRLVASLLKEGCEVTVASAGRTENPFGNSVTSIKFDRFDMADAADRLSSAHYDVLFDQLCFGQDDAKNIVDVFRNRIGHYVFVSSGAVYYPGKSEYEEGDFDPTRFSLQSGSNDESDYAEGKRSAEAYFFQNAPFSVAAARFPIVIGHDDSSIRFQKHVKSVMLGEEIVIPPHCGRRNYVWVEDAGRFMSWLGLRKKTGPYNGASPYGLDAVELVDRIGRLLNRTPDIRRQVSAVRTSSYFIEADRTLSAVKAEKECFAFTPFEEWFPAEVKLTVEAGADTGGVPHNSMDYFKKNLPGKG